MVKVVCGAGKDLQLIVLDHLQVQLTLLFICLSIIKTYQDNVKLPAYSVVDSLFLRHNAFCHAAKFTVVFLLDASINELNSYRSEYLIICQAY